MITTRLFTFLSAKKLRNISEEMKRRFGKLKTVKKLGRNDYSERCRKVQQQRQISILWLAFWNFKGIEDTLGGTGICSTNDKIQQCRSKSQKKRCERLLESNHVEIKITHEQRKKEVSLLKACDFQQYEKMIKRFLW